MTKKGKKRGRVKYKNLIILRTKIYFLVKQKAFLIIFKKFYFDSKYKNSGHKLYVDIINLCSLCYGKCITQVKDGPFFIKFLKSVYSSYTIHSHETADIFGGHLFLQILVEGHSQLFALPFLTCFLYHLSITDVLCCLLIFCGHKREHQQKSFVMFSRFWLLQGWGGGEVE